MTDTTTPKHHRHVRKWWIIAAVTTVAIIVAAEGAVRLASGKLGDPLVWYSRSAQNKVNTISKPGEPDAPVVFIGSSAVNASLDPGQFRRGDVCGRRAYNAATNGAVPSMNIDWLYREI